MFYICDFEFVDTQKISEKYRDQKFSKFDLNCILEKMIKINLNVLKLLDLVLKMIVLKTSKTPQNNKIFHINF